MSDNDLRILVVEHEPSVALVISSALERRGQLRIDPIETGRDHHVHFGSRCRAGDQQGDQQGD